MFQGSTKKILWVFLPMVVGGFLLGWFALKTKPNSTAPLQKKVATIAKPYQTIPSEILSQSNIQQLMAKDPGKIQLVEFFNYGCYGCRLWHPTIEAWIKKNPQVALRRFPIVFNQNWEPFAKLFYVVGELGYPVSDDVIFSAIHDEHQNLADETVLSQFFTAQGVSSKKAMDLYNSFSVHQDISKAKKIAENYQIIYSPSVVLNTPEGSYIITPSLVESNRTSLAAVLDELSKGKRS